MTCWDVLDLPPDADSRTIKRTYAALLKKTRPDDNPEGFQRLREAYEAALNGQESVMDDASAAVAVEMAAPEPVDGTLPQRYQQALAQGNGLAFEVALLERCISDDTVSDEELRWAFDTFHWLSAWQRLELPAQWLDALASQCRQALRSQLALALAQRNEADFLNAYARRDEHAWLRQPAHAQWFNQTLATLLCDGYFWLPALFEAVRAGQGWPHGGENPCPEDEWQHLLRREQAPAFIAHQRALAVAPPHTAQQRAARLLLAPMTLGQRRAFAQRLSEADWEACRALAARIKTDHPDVALSLPGGTAYFWQEWETAVDTWPLALATVLGCVTGALFQAPWFSGVLVSTLGHALVWSMAYVVVGALAWQMWRPLVHRVRVLDESLAVRLPTRLCPTRLPLLPLRDLLPGAIMSVAISVQFGAVAGLMMVATLVVIGAGKRQARTGYKEWSTRHPRKTIGIWGLVTLLLTMMFAALKSFDSHYQVGRNQGLQQWTERVCSRMPRTAQPCQAPATQAQWYGQEAE